MPQPLTSIQHGLGAETLQLCGKNSCEWGLSWVMRADWAVAKWNRDVSAGMTAAERRKQPETEAGRWTGPCSRGSLTGAWRSQQVFGRKVVQWGGGLAVARPRWAVRWRGQAWQQRGLSCNRVTEGAGLTYDRVRGTRKQSRERSWGLFPKFHQWAMG